MGVSRFPPAAAALMTVSCSLATDLGGLDLGSGGAGSQPAVSASAGGSGGGGASSSTATASATGGGVGGDPSGGGSGGGGAGASGGGGASAGGGGAGQGGAPQLLSFGEHVAADVKNVTADTYVEGSSPDLNYGSDTYFEADADPERVMLLRFDVAALPPSTVTAVELHVWTSSNFSSGRFSIHEVLEPWDEGNVSGETGVCNWTTRLANTPWTTAGVGVGSRSAIELAAFVPGADYTEFTVSLPADLVQGWAADPSSNHGLAIRTTSTDAATFRASEHPDLDHRPRLDVWYLPY